MSMTELERVTNQRDYNRRLADHQQTVIDRLNAEITAMQDDAREKRVVMIAAEELADAAECIRHWHDAMADGSGMVVSSEHVHKLREKVTAYRAATGAA